MIIDSRKVDTGLCSELPLVSGVATLLYDMVFACRAVNECDGELNVSFDSPYGADLLTEALEGRARLGFSKTQDSIVTVAPLERVGSLRAWFLNLLGFPAVDVVRMAHAVTLFLSWKAGITLTLDYGGVLKSTGQFAGIFSVDRKQPVLWLAGSSNTEWGRIETLNGSVRVGLTCGAWKRDFSSMEAENFAAWLQGAAADARMIEHWLIRAIGVYQTLYKQGNTADGED